MVKPMKKLIVTSWNNCSLDEDAHCHAFLQYKNTPSRKDGLSPCPVELQHKTHFLHTTTPSYHPGKNNQKKLKQRPNSH